MALKEGALQLDPEMKLAMVVKWGCVSADNAMNRTFSRQSASILRLPVIPLE